MLKSVFIFLIIFTCFSLSAKNNNVNKLKQDTTHIEVKHFNAQHLRNYKKQSDFNYKEATQKPSIVERIFNWFIKMANRFLSWLFGVEKATGILKTTFLILPYLILVLCLFILTMFFIKINVKQLTDGTLSNSKNVQVFDEDALLKFENLDQLINKAVADGNFRLAIRFEYLKILKQLSTRNLINWQVHKTNDDYCNELSNNDLKPVFKQSTLMFDYVWYGSFLVNDAHYKSIKSIFDDLLIKINHIEPKK